MKIRSPFSAAAAATVLLGVSSLQAWNNFGHMTVAYVAYRALDAKTRARVDRLLTLNPYYKEHWLKMLPPGTAPGDQGAYIFALAATWPDAIKRDSQYHNDGAAGGDRPTGPQASRNTGYDDFNRHKYWHFVDTPFSDDGTALPALPSPNAETEVDAFRAILAFEKPDALKSYDLVWLLHLVGDLHQPLHCATRVSKTDPDGDAGGNRVGFCSATAPKCTGELHAFWDDVLGTSDSPASVKAFAVKLTVPPVNVAGTAHQWIGESFALARSQVYGPPVAAGDGPFRATAQYAANARDAARRQVALAGARLAVLLKAELK